MVKLHTVWFTKHTTRSDFLTRVKCFVFLAWTWLLWTWSRFKIDSHLMHFSANERSSKGLIANQNPHFKYEFENPAVSSIWGSFWKSEVRFWGIIIIIFIVPKRIRYFKAQKCVLGLWISPWTTVVTNLQ